MTLRKWDEIKNSFFDNVREKMAEKSYNNRTLSLEISGSKPNESYMSGIFSRKPALRIDVVVEIAEALGVSVDDLLYGTSKKPSTESDVHTDGQLDKLVEKVTAYAKAASYARHMRPSFDEVTKIIEDSDGDVARLGRYIEEFDIYQVFETEPFIKPLRIGRNTVGFQTYGTTNTGPLIKDISGTLRSKVEMISKDYIDVVQTRSTHFSTQSINEVIYGARHLQTTYDRMLFPGFFEGKSDIVINFGIIQDIRLSISMDGTEVSI